jgi:hypothetical protein
VRILCRTPKQLRPLTTTPLRSAHLPGTPPRRSPFRTCSERRDERAGRFHRGNGDDGISHDSCCCRPTVASTAAVTRSGLYPTQWRIAHDATRTRLASRSMRLFSDSSPERRSGARSSTRFARRDGGIAHVRERRDESSVGSLLVLRARARFEASENSVFGHEATASLGCTERNRGHPFHRSSI